jgi:DNA-binding CsgD family transcriptional regulator/anti-anti-sigma regulatory factor
MEIAHSTRDGCLVVTLTGEVTVATASQVQHTLLKGLSEGPLAIVCDLGGVDVLDPVCATVFATVANHPASHWPATPLLLCGARPAVAEVLGTLDARHFLPLYANLEEALGAVLDRPGSLRDELRLAPTPAAAAGARRFVRETLERWSMSPPEEELSAQAQLLAGELVTAAAVHAQTDMLLRLELSRELLRIAVRDLEGPAARAHARGAWPQFTATLPVHGAEARVEAARGYLAVTGPAGSRTVLREVGEVLRRRQHPGLHRPAAQAHAFAGRPGDVPETSDLTDAERRLLPLLATHLTFREIGERLDLSSHTVRAQMIPIYVKLGVASRGQAIQRARHLGML